MKSNCSRMVHQVLMLAVLVLALDADSEDSNCTLEIRVRRNTVYKATVGKDFRINCPIVFCNNPPPTVTWYKLGEPDLLVNVSSNSHIKTEWKTLKEMEGTLFLVFTNFLMSDSGQYQCHAGGSISHTINVTVTKECFPRIRVRRNTINKATVGQDLRINCPIVFCNNPPPTVSWYKLGGTDLLVNVSSNIHIKMEWKMLNETSGTSFLIFTNILMNDSGQYQCRTEENISHTVTISVYDDYETTNEQPSAPNSIWPNVYRIIGLTVFVITVLAICLTAKRRCKGKSGNTANRRHLQNSFSTHVYDNVR